MSFDVFIIVIFGCFVVVCYQEINDFRGRCGSLFLYDWITVPIVYTQVKYIYESQDFSSS